jgi:hypothetical protein
MESRVSQAFPAVRIDPRTGSIEPVAPPTARGPLTSWLLKERLSSSVIAPPRVRVGSGFGDDLQLALYLCYETHYSDVPGWSAGDEWDPSLLLFRAALEEEFLSCLRAALCTLPTSEVRESIPALIDADDSPSVSRYMLEAGTLDQMREFVIHRSAYQLKEGDPHTFAIPRLDGRAKQLLVEIQAGEYGADESDRVMHAELFACTMRALGLDDRRHVYLDQLPASSLMVSNLISMFGLHRRWRGALIGHLAVFEMTSVAPMGRYSAALERLGAPAEARRFYDVHVLADAEHELMALELAGILAEQEPELVPDILFGAASVIAVEAMFAQQLLSGWGQSIDSRSAA